MKRRDIIRNAAAGSLLVTGAGSAGAMHTKSESGSTMYKLENTGDGFEVVDTFDGSGAGAEHHCDSPNDDCCVDDCCGCSRECGICFCHKQCDEDQFY